MSIKIMRVFTVVVVLVLVAASLGVSAEPPSETYPRIPLAMDKGGDVVPGEVIIDLEPGVSASSLALDVIEHVASLDVDLVRVPVGREASEASRLRAMPGVRLAQPNYVYSADLVPNDQYYAANQHNLPHIGMPAAWDITTGSSDVVVAVLDTGVDMGHPELSGQVVAGSDPLNGDSDPSDDNGHGTHVAGIVAAASNNSVGVASVAWNARIMPVKVLGSDGRGSTTATAAGIRWAVDNGADVINMSLSGTGDPGGDLVQKAAVDYAYANGVILIASMGNLYTEGNPVLYPAAHDHVVAVGSVDNLDQHAGYSCTGPHNDLMAPGGDIDGDDDNDPEHWIMSTGWRGKGSDWAWYTGTSQAAPHVAGLAALMLAVNPGLTPDQIEQIMKDTAVDLGAAGFDNTFGYGRIDAAAALSHVAGQATPTATSQPPSATPTLTEAPPSATPTPTGDTTPLPQTRRAFLPVLLRSADLSVRPTPTTTSTAQPGPTDTPTMTMTPEPQPSASPTATTTQAPPSATPTTEPMAELPVAGDWVGDWIDFTVGPDQRTITYLYYLADCGIMYMDTGTADIAEDGSWLILFGDQTFGGGVLGQFTSATTCEGQAESWNVTDPQDPCHAIESWEAVPEQ